MDPRELTDLVCTRARAAGFDRAGVAVAGEVARAEYVRRWLDEGMGGEMAYLSRWRELRIDPRRLLPGARSVIVVAHSYRQRPSGATAGGEGERRMREGGADQPPPAEISRSKTRNPPSRIAQYAWGRDYHLVIREKLRQLVDELRQAIPEAFDSRVCVDTAPVLERELAAAAGVGWIGKNTLVMHESLGSYFFLGEIITTLELAPTGPATDHCGTCTRCLEACPTAALSAPYQMDARRCISYLTIEHRSEIPVGLAPLIGDWLYGCDICQDVCPHNRKAPPGREPVYAPGSNPLVPEADMDAVLSMSQEDYARAVAGSAMQRASLQMLQRNARIVQENADRSARPPAAE